jgi:ADP-heptose:LPS heptosyltransferase
MKNVLVIMHGALGDWIFATAAFKSVRKHHKNAHITLLTSSPFAELAKKSPFFDSVWIDDRPRVYKLFSLVEVLKQLRSNLFDRVYDFKNTNRTRYYRKWMKGRFDKWIPWPKKPKGRHVIEWRNLQLQENGVVETFDQPVIDWMDEPIALPYSLFALLIPGSATFASEKRWPESSFLSLSKKLKAEGIEPILVGKESFPLLETECTSLRNKTTLNQLSYLAKNALFAVGGDTGPSHLVAARGCPTLFLYGHNRSLITNGPRGAHTKWIYRSPLSELDCTEVLENLNAFKTC